MALIDGKEYLGTPTDPEYGTNPKNGKPEMRFMMEVVEGDSKGQRVPYKANTKNPQSTSYAKRDMVAAGWQGKTVGTFVADLTAANKAGKKMTFVARLASFTRDDGTVSQWWTVGSIGYSAPPLAAPTNDITKNVDSWFADAPDAATPATGNNNSRHPNAPGNDDDLPF